MTDSSNKLALITSSKKAFEDFLVATNESGSGKAASYIRAIQLLEQMLSINAFGFSDCQSIYDVVDLERLEELVVLVRKQQKNDSSDWFSDASPKVI